MISFFARLPRPRHVIRWLFLSLVLLMLAIFAYNVIRYVSAIKKGDTQPLLEQQLRATIALQQKNRPVTAEDLTRLQPPSSPALGKKDAPLVLVEFLDFSCPFCKETFPVIRELTNRYHDQIYFITRNFPVDELHPRATAAARAAQCAHEQGKYWSYHDKLYADQDHHEDIDLQRFATEVGLNLNIWKTCIKDQRSLDKVQRDLADGIRAGVAGTPTFFFNGIKIQGALDVRTFEYIIKLFLDHRTGELNNSYVKP